MKFIRMAFSFIISAAAVVIANGIRETLPEQAMEQQPSANGAVLDCAAIQAAAYTDGEIPFPRGNLTLDGPLHCDEPTIWAIEEDTAIESRTAIDMLDIVFIVFYDVHLVFRAPAVSLKRGVGKFQKLTIIAASLSQDLQEMEEEILSNVGGTVKFEVSGPHPSYTSASAVDTYGLVNLVGGSNMLSNHPPHYTSMEIVVAAEPSDLSTYAVGSTPNDNSDIISSNDGGDNRGVTTTEGGASADSPQDSTTSDLKGEPFPTDFPTSSTSSSTPTDNSNVSNDDGDNTSGVTSAEGGACADSPQDSTTPDPNGETPPADFPTSSTSSSTSNDNGDVSSDDDDNNSGATTDGCASTSANITTTEKDEPQSPEDTLRSPPTSRPESTTTADEPHIHHADDSGNHSTPPPPTSRLRPFLNAWTQVMTKETCRRCRNHWTQVRPWRISRQWRRPTSAWSPRRGTSKGGEEHVHRREGSADRIPRTWARRKGSAASIIRARARSRSKVGLDGWPLPSAWTSRWAT
eukprot:g16479.t1